VIPQVLQLAVDAVAFVLEPVGEFAQVASDHPMFGPSLDEIEQAHSYVMGNYVDPYLPDTVVSARDTAGEILNTPGVSDALLGTIRVPPLGGAIGGYADEVSLAKQLHNLRPSGFQRSQTTTAVISALDENDNLMYFVANNYGLTQEQQQAIKALGSNFITVPIPRGNVQHPEMLILQYAGLNHPNHKLLRAGASWTICENCTPVLQQQGVQVLNPRKN
jgi:hypothetical protein